MDYRGRGRGEGRIERHASRAYENQQGGGRDAYRKQLEEALARKQTQLDNVNNQIAHLESEMSEASYRNQTNRFIKLQDKCREKTRISAQIIYEIGNIRDKLNNIF